ncbi:Putative peptide transport system permease protein BAB2_1050 [Hyphomicrobiales bacterium]|nr:Putative peptide transport system permease protein BAB2_1050 [Hyphomicrobiales bacterium]CAH1693358.1 putative peptide transport system permease protein BAB2_1050 [Hyphomicrobiales bacterium]
MFTYVLRKLTWTALVMVVVSLIIFAAVRLIPSDAVDMMFQAESGSPERRAELRRMLGLDRAWYTQYLSWLGGILTGQFGTSLRSGIPVGSEIARALPVTLELVLLGTLLGSFMGITLGVLAARFRGTFVDWLIQPIGLIGLSIPNFWLGSLFLIGVGFYLPGMRIVGYVPFLEDPVRNLSIMVLPALALGLALGAAVMRMTRTSVLEVMQQDYVRTARAKGVREPAILRRHVLKNGLIPVVTVITIQIGVLIGGSIVLERVFALPGLGRLLVTAIGERDYTMVQGITLVIAFIFVMINLLTDLVYRLLDPRVKVA